MKSILLPLFAAVVTINFAAAQGLKSKDKEAIKKMCGCFEVEFNFAETFNYSDDSLYKASKTKHEVALEWAGLLSEDDDKIVIQHLLIVGPEEHPHIVKHWRQDWTYEAQELYMFDHKNQWKYMTYPADYVRGKWRQEVYQVDDSPRYSGFGSWVYADGKTYWESTTDAPLPRREYTKRVDYNVTERGNRHEITDFGWVHDQDNKKIIRKVGEKDVILAEEKGFNTYTKVDDSRCKAAQDWWEEHKAKWSLIRDEWRDVYSANADLKLESLVDDKKLFRVLFELPVDASTEDIHEVISSYVVRTKQ